MDIDKIQYEEEPIGGPQSGPVEISIEEDALNIVNDVIINDRDDMQWDEQTPKETEAEEEVEEAEKPLKKKNKISFEKRFKQVYSEKKQMEELLHQQYEENQRLQSMVQEKNITSVLLAEDALDQRMERAKSVLKTAIDNGDTDLQVDAYAEFSRLQGEKNEINSYKAANGIQSDRKQSQSQQMEPQYEERRYNQPQEERQPEPTPELSLWLNENPFMDANSPEFDQDMYNEVRGVDSRLARQYTKAGKKSQIGTQKYFDELNAYIAENFDDEGEVYVTENPQMKSPSTSVASPRQISNPLSSNKSPTRINLTPDEVDIALNMNFQHPNGKQYTREESCRAYAIQKIKMMKQ